MALAEVTSQTHRPVQFAFADAFRAVVRWVDARRAVRARKVALQGLLLAPEHRLRDLGITREDVLAAIDCRRK